MEKTINDKVEELQSRLGDIQANVNLGPKNIRKYKSELMTDILASEVLIKDLTKALAQMKSEVGE